MQVALIITGKIQWASREQLEPPVDEVPVYKTAADKMWLCNRSKYTNLHMIKVSRFKWVYEKKIELVGKREKSKRSGGGKVLEPQTRLVSGGLSR